MWVNDLEANGVTGVDDDDNGYIDDIHGWDFGNDDADPMSSPPGSPDRDHGTHCAGIACAATNNNIGIAGVSWGCTFMPVKVKSDDTDSFLTGFEGIVYAADNGADIISNSWGGPGYLQSGQDVINYCT